MFTLPVDDDLTLRLHDEHQVAAQYDLIAANRKFLSQHLAWPAQVNRIADTRRFIQRARRTFGNGQRIGTAIYYQGQFVGNIGLHIRDKTVGSAEMGYWLGEAFTGRGIMTRCARALLDYAFTTLQLHKVVILSATSNQRSAAIPLRLGFSEDGIEKHGAVLSGDYIDFRIFRLLADDWSVTQPDREFEQTLDEHTALRLLTQRDAERLFALTDRNRAHITPWLPGINNTKTVEDTRQFINDALVQYGDSNGMHMGIWVDGEICGTIGYHFWDHRHKKTEIGYWLDQATTGRGVMTRSVAALVDYAYDVLDLHRVEIYCAVENEKSCAIPARLGFTHEVTQRGKQWLHDRYHDAAVYAMLAPNWKGSYAHLQCR